MEGWGLFGNRFNDALTSKDYLAGMSRAGTPTDNGKLAGLAMLLMGAYQEVFLNNNHGKRLNIGLSSGAPD